MIVRCEEIRPTFHEKNLVDVLAQPRLFESGRQKSNRPAFARTGQGVAFALPECAHGGKWLRSILRASAHLREASLRIQQF
jgi:hypothetical protein